MAITVRKNPVCLSLGVLACNEKESIRRTLESLFRQNIFEKLWHRHEQCEVVVVANGCTDQTAAIAQDALDHLVRTHEWAEAISVRVVEIPEPGKCNAWNRFVHEFSSLEARYLGVMDARISFPHRNTLFALVAALDRRAYANLVSGHRWHEALFKPTPSFADRFALATAEMLAAGRPTVCGQLYCIRARIARQIFLPRALGAEPALLRELLCTELLSRRADPARITSLPDAAHLADLATGGLAESRREILNRATAHALLDYLRSRPPAERRDLIETIRQLEACDPEWLSKLVRQQVRHRRFWQLFPGSLTFRLCRLWHRANWNRWTLLPASVVELGRTIGALWSAHRLLRQGIIAEVGATSRAAVPVQLGTK